MSRRSAGWSALTWRPAQTSRAVTIGAETGTWNTDVGAIETPAVLDAATDRGWSGQLLIVQMYYVPLPEDQIKASLTRLYASTGTTIDSTISIVPAQNNAIVYYDHWEDGYEANIESPMQTSTQVWGDGNPANGMPPGFITDVLTSDDVITLRNNLTVPRGTSPILYDGRDKIVSTRAIAVTRSAWATMPGAVLSGAIEVVAVNNWGSEYVSPVGQNAPNSAFNEIFEYVSMLVMASTDGTTVQIDVDGNGSVDTDSDAESGPELSGRRRGDGGAHVTADQLVQVQLIAGDIGANYECDWFTLYPRDAWSSTYYNPVGTTVADDPAATFLYNPNATPITINYRRRAAPEPSRCRPPRTPRRTASCVSRCQPTPCSLLHHRQPRARVLRLGRHGHRQSGAANNVHDWGFSLVPDTYLTPALKVGWAPGAGDQPISANGNPVWVMGDSGDAHLRRLRWQPADGSAHGSERQAV